MDDMISMITERRGGKTTRLLQMAIEHGRSDYRYILTFNYHAAKYLMEQAMDVFNGYECKVTLSTMTIDVNGIIFRFRSFRQFIEAQKEETGRMKEYDVYIDELPICLRGLLGGDVKMFTGSCLKMAGC